MRNITFNIIAFITLVSVCIGCTKGKELVSLTGDTYTVTGSANGSQMVPANSLSTTATFNGWLDEQANVLTFTLAWTGIFSGTATDNITAIKFYGPAAPGAEGSLIKTISFINANASGSVNLGLGGNSQLSAAELNVLYGGNCYYLITTQRYPNGIVRGQLKAVKN